jgi:hypothetical protein
MCTVLAGPSQGVPNEFDGERRLEIKVVKELNERA